MSPKPGTPVTLVPPTAPADAAEADNAKAGQVDELETQSGKPKPPPKLPPHKVPATRAEKKEKPSWIEIELIDEADKPVPGVRYRVELPDGTADEGTLDGKGFARIEGIEPGTCKITFPKLDEEAWEKA